jgi:hypothetical protein
MAVLTYTDIANKKDYSFTYNKDSHSLIVSCEWDTRSLGFGLEIIGERSLSETTTFDQVCANIDLCLNDGSHIRELAFELAN